MNATEITRLESNMGQEIRVKVKLIIMFDIIYMSSAHPYEKWLVMSCQ